MKRLEWLLLALAFTPAAAQETVTLEEVLRRAAESPRVLAAAREADAVRAERDQAGALPNPSVSLAHTRNQNASRTVIGADTQEQASVELPVPIFGQRAARVAAAERQVGRAQSQVRLTANETRRLAAITFSRLLGAQEQLTVRRNALAEVERIRGLVAGRLENGMASRYDQARADAEIALTALGVQRASADVNEHAGALAGLLAVPGWQPRAAGSLAELQLVLAEQKSELPEDSPAARLARDELIAAEARIDLAKREQFPVPSVSLGRSWTAGPFGAANFVGLSSEIPVFDDRRALVDKARAEAAAARERERAVNAGLQAEFRRHKETLRSRREALARFEKDVFERREAFLEMAESAYRLGRGTLFELLDARRTQAEAAAARIELIAAIVESEIELRALAGRL